MKNENKLHPKTDILRAIIEHKRVEVEESKRNIPEAEMAALARKRTERRPFIQALSKPGPHGVNIIAEIKRASPSKGMIREDLDIEAQARAYQRGRAAAISVLTDERFFKGSPDFIGIVRKAADLPVLRKEFIISPYQVYESLHLGADAILLIAAALEAAELRDLIGLCRELNLDVLVEAHSQEEMETAVEAGAMLVGINNRDLKTFRVDIETSARLAKLLQPGRIPVAESGIYTRQDIEKLLSEGVWNFLIGESLVRAENPEAMLKELMGAV